jgi:hypothetical protein
MANPQVSFFIDDASVNALQDRVPYAIVNSGMFGGGSCANGIGISVVQSGLGESLPSWTLLDQFGNARNAQRSQMIGGPAISNPSESNGQEGTLPAASIRLLDAVAMPTYAEKKADPNVDGRIPAFGPLAGASLIDLDVGWAPQAVV